MDKATVRDIDVRGKRVLVRVDFNVPLDDEAAQSPMTRASAPRCRRSTICWTTAPRSS